MTKIITARSPVFSLIILAVLMGVSIEGRSMGLFDFLKVVMASEFNGVVTLEGKPLAGVKVTRSVEDEDIITQETTTDANGRFSFDEVTKTSLKTLTPLEPVYGQVVTIHYQKEEYKGVMLNKRNYYAGGELKYINENDNRVIIPLNFICELTTEEKLIETKGSSYLGICRLKSDS